MTSDKFFSVLDRVSLLFIHLFDIFGVAIPPSESLFLDAKILFSA